MSRCQRSRRKSECWTTPAATSGCATWRSTAGPPPRNGVSGVFPILRIGLSGAKYPSQLTGRSARKPAAVRGRPRRMPTVPRAAGGRRDNSHTHRVGRDGARTAQEEGARLTGLEITRVGLGAWAVGGGGFEWSWGAQDDEDSIAAIHRALELGANWIDTAASTASGTEEVVGRAIAGLDKRPFIFTKGGQPEDKAARRPRPDARRASASSKEASCASAWAVDLYQIHWPIPDGDRGWARSSSSAKKGSRATSVSPTSASSSQPCQGTAPVETPNRRTHSSHVTRRTRSCRRARRDR
jgi:hypothetical protein